MQVSNNDSYSFEFDGEIIHHWFDGEFHCWEWSEGYQGCEHYMALSYRNDFMSATAIQLHSPGEWMQVKGYQDSLRAEFNQSLQEALSNG